MISNEERILKIHGVLPAPSVTIIGGTHGNERTGIEVVRKLQDEISSGKRVVAGGTLTLILGNPLAIEKNVRAIDGRDLNRYFSATMLAADDGSEEFRRAGILASHIRTSDIVIDIHATNKPSVPFVASKNDEAHRNVFRWFHPQCVLTDPHYIFGGGVPVTIDEYADSLGKIGLCFETGWVGDETMIPAVYDSVVRYCTSIGIFAPAEDAAPTIDSVIYEITAAVLRNDLPFVFAEGRGLRSFEKISATEVVGYHGNDPVYAESDGVIIFPKLPEHQHVGKPVCYVAKKIT